MPILTDAELLKQWHAGDGRAGLELMRRYYDVISAEIQSSGLPNEIAVPLGAEIMGAVWKDSRRNIEAWSREDGFREQLAALLKREIARSKEPPLQLVVKVNATAAEYALVRQMRQLKKSITNPAVVIDVTLQVTADGMYLVRKQSYERIALDGGT